VLTQTLMRRCRHFAAPLLLACSVLLVFFTFSTPAAAQPQTPRNQIIASKDNPLQVQLAKDIVRQITRPAGLNLDIRFSSGSPDTLSLLAAKDGIQLGMLQSDVKTAYELASQEGRSRPQQLLDPLRVVAPLHDEIVYFIVRHDAPINALHQIVGARINVGPLDGGTALSAATLYRLMFGTALPAARTSFLPHDKALVKLLTDRSIDVVVLVAPRAAKLLTEMTPKARRFVKLLAFDPSQPTSNEVLKTYHTATIGPVTHPNLLSAELTALALQIYLVTRDQNGGDNHGLERMAAIWCKEFPGLQARWANERPTSAPEPALAPGWRYSTAFEKVRRDCP
jgi:TRAP-type uncharacterized transport system substrate-binding protein